MLGILIVESSAAVYVLWQRKHRDTKEPLSAVGTWVGMIGLIVTLFLIGYLSVALTHATL